MKNILIKKVISALLVTMLIFNLTIVTSTFAAEQNADFGGKTMPVYETLIDVAVGKTVAATAEINPDLPLSHFTDGYLNSVTGMIGAAWGMVTIDLGQNYPISRVDFAVQNGTTPNEILTRSNFKIVASQYPNWEKDIDVLVEYSTDPALCNQWNRINANIKNYRYIGFQKTSDNPLNIAEVKVLAKLPVAEPSRGGAVTSPLGVVDGGAGWADMAYATDGNVASRWISQQSDPSVSQNWGGNIFVDMGAKYYIDQMEYVADPHSEGNDGNCAFSISLADDGNLTNRGAIAPCYSPVLSQGISNKRAQYTDASNFTIEPVIFGVDRAKYLGKPQTIFIQKDPNDSGFATSPWFSAAEIRGLTILPKIVDMKIETIGATQQLSLYFSTIIDGTSISKLTIDSVAAKGTFEKNVFKTDITNMPAGKHTISIAELENTSNMKTPIEADKTATFDTAFKFSLDTETVPGSATIICNMAQPCVLIGAIYRDGKLINTTMSTEQSFTMTGILNGDKVSAFLWSDVNDKMIPYNTVSKIMTIPNPASDFFVAKNGKDTNDGSRIAPFATVEKAVQEVKKK